MHRIPNLEVDGYLKFFKIQDIQNALPETTTQRRRRFLLSGVLFCFRDALNAVEFPSTGIHNPARHREAYICLGILSRCTISPATIFDLKWISIVPSQL